MYQTPEIANIIMSLEGGLCDVISPGSDTNDFSNKRDHDKEDAPTDKQWGNLWGK